MSNVANRINLWVMEFVKQFFYVAPYKMDVKVKIFWNFHEWVYYFDAHFPLLQDDWEFANSDIVCSEPNGIKICKFNIRNPMYPECYFYAIMEEKP